MATAKDSDPRTTIWREVSDATKLVETILGFPFGTPAMGQRVQIPKHGQAVCTGVTKSGTGKDERVVEIKLTIK